MLVVYVHRVSFNNDIIWNWKWNDKTTVIWQELNNDDDDDDDDFDWTWIWIWIWIWISTGSLVIDWFYSNYRGCQYIASRGGVFIIQRFDLIWFDLIWFIVKCSLVEMKRWNRHTAWSPSIDEIASLQFNILLISNRIEPIIPSLAPAIKVLVQ